MGLHPEVEEFVMQIASAQLISYFAGVHYYMRIVPAVSYLLETIAN